VDFKKQRHKTDYVVGLGVEYIHINKNDCERESVGKKLLDHYKYVIMKNLFECKDESRTMSVVYWSK